MFEAFTLKSEEVEQKEDQLRSEIRALDEEHRKSFYRYIHASSASHPLVNPLCIQKKVSMSC